MGNRHNAILSITHKLYFNHYSISFMAHLFSFECCFKNLDQDCKHKRVYEMVGGIHVHVKEMFLLIIGCIVVQDIAGKKKEEEI